MLETLAPPGDSILHSVADALDPPVDPYINEPVLWVDQKLREVLWSKQCEIMEMVRDNRYSAVQSAHDTGKSYIASRIAAWWLDSHPVGEAFVVTTAPTQPQVNAILWREIRAAHRRGDLSGRITLDAHWYMGHDELVAYGRKPQDYADASQAMQAFQGIHARYVLVIIDEGCGVPKWLYDAADSLVTNENSRVLVIGNPDDPASHFERVCRPGSGWAHMSISVFDTPAFTGESVPPELLEVLVGPTWVQERKQRWGEKSPLYTSKVLGQFPDISDDTLIMPKWVREAQERDLSGSAINDMGKFGADVARFGDDETVAIRVRGLMARVAHAAHKQDTVATTGAFAKLIKGTSNQVEMVIDADGLGAGPFDNIKDMGLRTRPFHGAARPNDPERFANRRAECYWELREAFESEQIDIDPLDDILASQLQSIKWKLNKKGKILIESKDDMKKRGMPSPDRADALMMAWTGEQISVEDFLAQPAGSTETDDIMEMQF